MSIKIFGAICLYKAINAEISLKLYNVGNGDVFGFFALLWDPYFSCSNLVCGLLNPVHNNVFYPERHTKSPTGTARDGAKLRKNLCSGYLSA